MNNLIVYKVAALEKACIVQLLYVHPCLLLGDDTEYLVSASDTNLDVHRRKYFGVYAGYIDLPSIENDPSTFGSGYVALCTFDTNEERDIFMNKVVESFSALAACPLVVRHEEIADTNSYDPKDLRTVTVV